MAEMPHFTDADRRRQNAERKRIETIHDLGEMILAGLQQKPGQSRNVTVTKPVEYIDTTDFKVVNLDHKSHRDASRESYRERKLAKMADEILSDILSEDDSEDEYSEDGLDEILSDILSEDDSEDEYSEDGLDVILSDILSEDDNLDESYTPFTPFQETIMHTLVKRGYYNMLKCSYQQMDEIQALIEMGEATTDDGEILYPM